MRRQRNIVPMKEQNKTQKMNQTEIVNLLDVEFKTLLIRMLRELTEYGKCIREEMKATLSEIKKNTQRTNSKGKEARVQGIDLAHKEEINIQLEQKEETRIQRNEERLRNIWYNLNVSTSKS